MDPMGGVFEHHQLALLALLNTRAGHLPAEKDVVGAPEQQGWDRNWAGGGALGRHAPEGPIPVQHRAQGLGLGPGLTVLLKVSGGKGARAAALL